MNRGVGELVALWSKGLLDAIGAQGKDRLALRVGVQFVPRDKLRAAVGCHAILVRRKDPCAKCLARDVSGGVSVVGDGELRPRQRGVALCRSSCLGIQLLDYCSGGRACRDLLNGTSLHLRCGA